MSATEEVRILQDEDCPRCGWPEIVAIGVLSVGPDRVECARRQPCGWSAKVVGGLIVPAPKLTKPRATGLRMLLARGECRRSNSTSEERGTIYWQTVDWMVAEGYASRATGFDMYQLTEAGRLAIEGSP